MKNSSIELQESIKDLKTNWKDLKVAMKSCGKAWLLIFKKDKKK